MPQIDWEREGTRLQALYTAMSNEELQEVAQDADSLTEVARAVLRVEMLRRGMEAPPEREAQRKIEAPPEANVNVGAAEERQQRQGPVIVGRYRDLAIASVAKSILDSAGI